MIDTTADNGRFKPGPTETRFGQSARWRARARSPSGDYPICWVTVRYVLGLIVTILISVYVRRVLGPGAIGQVGWAMAVVLYLVRQR